MNTLGRLHESLLHNLNEVSVDPELCKKAMQPLQRMLDFRQTQAS
jgi:quinolinate synthase